MRLRWAPERRALAALTFPAIGILALGCQASPPAGRTPTVAPVAAVPAVKQVWSGEYAENIQPIFSQRCVSCHGPARAENGLRLDSYEGVRKGTQYGPVVAPGSVAGSTLLAVLGGATDPKLRMPHDGQKLTDGEIKNLTLWIEAGAPPN